MADSIRRVNNDAQLAAWWLYRLVMGDPHPLQEKMTLFWHNHFATSNAKVRNAGYMLGMYDLMNRHALGNFRDLLQEISKDPAMMVWLDTSQNKKGQANENYARELMELFSLGIGHYTEKDIRESARAFHRLGNPRRQSIPRRRPARRRHQDIPQPTGDWSGEDIVRICLDQESGPYFICDKLFRFLVSETIPPSRELIAPLADQLRNSGWDFGALVATVLRSNLFFDPQCYRTRVKSPVEFAVGIARARAAAALDIGSGGSKGWARTFPPAVGQRLGRRPRLAQRPDVALPPEPVAGVHVRRRPIDPAATRRTWSANMVEWTMARWWISSWRYFCRATCRPRPTTASSIICAKVVGPRQPGTIRSSANRIGRSARYAIWC